MANYSMPAHSGGIVGRVRSWTYADVTSILVVYETDLGQLAEHVPVAFETTQPIPVLSYAMNRGVEWIATA